MPRRKVPKGRGPVKATKTPKRAKTKQLGRALSADAKKRAAAEVRELRELRKALKEAEALVKANEKRAAKRRQIQEREHEKARKAYAKVAKVREKERERLKRGVKRTLAKAAKLLEKEGMSRHTASRPTALPDAEGFVPINAKPKRNRSEASKYGWKLRKARKFRAQGVSHFGAHDWAELSNDRADALERLTQDCMGPAAWLYGPKRHRFVRTGLENGDRRFALYMALAQEMGYTIRQARTALFSPRARPSLG